ncbi:MAG: acyl-CoA mutase large subunit family protein, partial [Alphaproteobacteria bacterium]|nr:acyl-CoA mutase large subunit family protein [Alphaproteobacteria bacterium]
MSSDDRTTISGIPLKPHYERADGTAGDEVPGQPPFTRGIFAEGYRQQPWMESLACGYGLPEETNQRVRYLAKVGQAGYGGRMSINLVFDRPTFCGLDSDDPLAESEVGNVGVAVDSLDDMARLFDGFDLDKLNVGFIVDRSGPMIMAMYIALADSLGIARDSLRGIVCNNPLTDFYCSKTPMFPPRDCLRLMVDCIEFCAAEVPRFNVARINGYNTRELGSNAIQEVGFNLAIAKTIIQACLDRGLAAEALVGGINFQFSQGRDFFEDICKIRAARRLWARMLREDFGVTEDGVCRMKIHMQTAGSSLTAQEPLNNIARIGLQVMSAALAGSQSMHIASYDEALGIPTEEAARVAIKTSKIVMHETGATDVADPLGGSYYVEALTDGIEDRVRAEMARVEQLGGVIKALETGYFEQEIANEAYRLHQQFDSGERLTVGVNCYREQEVRGVGEIFRPDPKVSRTAIARVRELKAGRDQAEAKRQIAAIEAAAAAGQPMMPRYIEAARARVTLGEM